VERTFLELWVSMGSLFECRHSMHCNRPCKRADLFGDCCGCRFHTTGSRDCKQQERSGGDHIESDARGAGRDEPATAYHDNFDVDHHDNSYDYRDADDKHDLHQHVHNEHLDDEHVDVHDDNHTDHVLERDWTLVWLDQRLEHTNPGHATTQY
jgi:hypothetical protein